MLNIRHETPADYQTVEDMTRVAFYNLYEPGCVEHYLVHTMRQHPDFIPELDDVLTLDGEIIGNVMYTKAKLVNDAGDEKEILTFGPLSIAPAFQRQGYGKQLLEYSFKQARQLGDETIVIFGSPMNYVGRGFQSSYKFKVSLPNGQYPAAMMVKELKGGGLGGQHWRYYDSPVMAVSEAAAQKYDATLAPLTKQHQPSQEEFYIISHAMLGDN